MKLYTRKTLKLMGVKNHKLEDAVIRDLLDKVTKGEDALINARIAWRTVWTTAERVGMSKYDSEYLKSIEVGLIDLFKKIDNWRGEFAKRGSKS